MSLDNNATKIICAIVAVLASGALISYRYSKKKRTTTTQSDIHVNGNNNKFTGGDDNSVMK